LSWVRLDGEVRTPVSFRVDGQPLEARSGDTVLTALLSAGENWLCRSEIDDSPRAGFCVMGVCQECRIHVVGHGPARACTTLVEAGMEVMRR
jgi:predicted molibdopterin-dependent oxidoreductase YjgC